MELQPSQRGALRRLAAVPGWRGGLPATAFATPPTEVTAADTDEAMRIERGIVFNELGDFDAAMQEFNAVLEANPKIADALYEAAITQ